jgi:hypothetical protein
MKAIVLEIKNGEAAVLREDGIVVTTRQRCRVGDTIEVSERIEVRPARRFSRLTRIASVAVLALVIAGSTFGYLSVDASSYVSVDTGEASLEFAVNHFGRVISVEGLDEDSEEFAQAIADEVRHKKFDDAMNCAMTRMEEHGLYDPEGEEQVVTGVMAHSERQREELKEDIEGCFSGGDRPAPPFYMMDVSPEERDEARDKHQSPGMFVFEQQGHGPGGHEEPGSGGMPQSPPPEEPHN